MSGPLSRMDLDLLDFLCICAHREMRFTDPPAERQASLESLRTSGLIEPDSLIPTPWAMADWLARNKIPAADSTPAAECPPRPLAGKKGGAADARCVAAAPPRANCDCGAELSIRTAHRRAKGTATGKCKPCWDADRRAKAAARIRPQHKCGDCGKPQVRPSRSGRCRRCFTIRMNHNPEVVAKRAITIRKICADPVYRAHQRQMGIRATANPEARERLARAGRLNKGRKKGPLAPEHSANISAGLLASHAARPAQAIEPKPPIKFKAAPAPPPAEPAMTEFERQLALVLSGKAKVVPKLVFRPMDPERTLGGVVGEIL